MREIKFFLVALAGLQFGTSTAGDAMPRRHHGHTHVARHRAPDGQALRQTEPAALTGYDASPTQNCRYEDGRPYDPDIIGGPNHVGDGGPGVNLGGSDPCGR